VMGTHDSQLGASTLRLLAEEPALQIMRELTGGPLRPVELGQRLPGVAHSAMMRRLADLTHTGAVTRERIRELPPRTYYSLANAGHALLEIPAACERWEQRWSTPGRGGAPGAWALRLLADEHARKIMLALAAEPLGPSALEQRLPGCGRSATRWRLGRLTLHGVLTRTKEANDVRYGLTMAARHLGIIATLAGRWEWDWVEEHRRLSALRRPPRQRAAAHRTPNPAPAEP